MPAEPLNLGPILQSLLTLSIARLGDNLGGKPPSLSDAAICLVDVPHPQNKLANNKVAKKQTPAA